MRAAVYLAQPPAPAPAPRAVTQLRRIASCGNTATSTKCTSAKEPDQTYGDQIDGDDVIEQSRHDEDQDACDERKKRTGGDMKIHVCVRLAVREGPPS